MNNSIHPALPEKSTTGKVYITGAGPGDPDLLTIKGAKALSEADVVVYDRLANPRLLTYAPEHAEHIYVGKRPDQPSVSQEQINRILISKALEGRTVVRLKGGDPFIFGRGSEECEALSARKIPFEVIPGISSFAAAPAFAGIPLTHRGTGRSFAVVTGHTILKEDLFHNWEHLSKMDTLVILMGVKNLEQISSTLIGYGRPGGTPVAIIEKATLPDQRILIGTLETIAEQASTVSSPATIVVGELAAMSHDLGWVHQSSVDKSEAVEASQIKKFAI